MSTSPKTFVRLLLVLVAAIFNVAAAQVTRVAVFPFDVAANTQAYQLGLPSAVQRALNQVPGVYAPPIGDVALVANKAVDAGADVNETVGRLFDAGALVTGQVTLGGGGVQAVVNVDMAGNVQTVQATGQGPDELAVQVAEALARIVAPDAASEVMDKARATASDTPSLPSHGPTGLSASGLPGATVTDLGVAAEAFAGSWLGIVGGRAAGVGSLPCGDQALYTSKPRFQRLACGRPRRGTGRPAGVREDRPAPFV